MNAGHKVSVSELDSGVGAVWGGMGMLWVFGGMYEAGWFVCVCVCACVCGYGGEFFHSNKTKKIQGIECAVNNHASLYPVYATLCGEPSSMWRQSEREPLSVVFI